jgi:putative peptidoglycan lipid II flippase
LGVSVLVAATLAGVVIETAILGWAVRRLGYPVWPAWSRSSSSLAGVRRQYLLLVAGAAIASGCGLVDQAVAASMDAGSVSVLAYGTKLAVVLSAIGATAAATVLLPEFSRHAQQRDWRPLRRAIRMIAVAILVLAIPAAALLIWTSGETVRLFFQGGAFQAAESVPVAGVQRWAMLQLPFAVLAMVAVRLANALSANALIVAASTLALAVNAVGDVWLSRAMGVSGIALAGALGQAVLLTSLIVLLWVREPRLFRAGRPA